MSWIVNKDGWINGDIFGMVVEHRPIPRPHGKNLYKGINTNKLVGHTVEGPPFGQPVTTGSMAGAIATFEKNSDPPHVLLGCRRIIQFRPLGYQAAALRSGGSANLTNREAEIQFELMGASSQNLWIPAEPELESLVGWLAFCNKELGIPLIRPAGWHDDLSDMKGEILASFSNSRRKSNTFFTNETGGIFMHLEVPMNNHWDMGAINWTKIIELTKAKLNVPITT